MMPIRGLAQWQSAGLQAIVPGGRWFKSITRDSVRDAVSREATVKTKDAAASHAALTG